MKNNNTLLFLFLGYFILEDTEMAMFNIILI